MIDKHAAAVVAMTRRRNDHGNPIIAKAAGWHDVAIVVPVICGLLIRREAALETLPESANSSDDQSRHQRLVRIKTVLIATVPLASGWRCIRRFDSLSSVIFLVDERYRCHTAADGGLLGKSQAIDNNCFSPTLLSCRQLEAAVVLFY